MKYYSEEETKDLRLAFEEQVLSWSRVTKKKMFGCPCYKADEKLFAFLVTKGIVITRLTESEREPIKNQYQITSFQAGKKIVQNWIKIPIKNKSDVDKIIPYVRKSYDNSIKEAKES